MRHILSKISEGKTIDALSRELGMRKTTTKAMVDSMIHAGYLDEVRCRSGCGMCAKGCNPSHTNSRTKMFGLTEKGIKLIKTA